MGVVKGRVTEETRLNWFKNKAIPPRVLLSFFSQRRLTVFSSRSREVVLVLIAIV